VGAGGGVAGWGLVTQGGVPPVVVVVVFPVADDHAGLGQRPEAVDVEAFVADAGVERNPPARMVLGVSTKPVPQSGVRIGWCRRGRFVALGGAMLPGYPAGQPLADPQHPLEVTNGRPPAASRSLRAKDAQVLLHGT
jgi:hypothetical protein